MTSQIDNCSFLQNVLVKSTLSKFFFDQELSHCIKDFVILFHANQIISRYLEFHVSGAHVDVLVLC